MTASIIGFRKHLLYVKYCDTLCKNLLSGHLFRSSRPEVFFKQGVLGNFAKFTGKHLCQSLFSNKVAGISLQFY